MKRLHDSDHNSWFYFAHEDLISAELLFKGGIYSQACLHAHQCTEKALKGCIILRGSSFRKTHDLNELLNLSIKIGEESLKKYSEEISVLNMFYISTRYPDGIPGSLADRLPAKEDATQAIATAENIYNYAMKLK